MVTKAGKMFSIAYADQNERDHAALVAAVRSGKVEVIIAQVKSASCVLDP